MIAEARPSWRSSSARLGRMKLSCDITDVTDRSPAACAKVKAGLLLEALSCVERGAVGAGE